MSRASRFRTICSLLALVLLLVGLRQLVEPAISLRDPLLATAELNCSPCAYRTDPVRLLDAPLRKQGWQTRGTEQRILARLEQPGVRRLMFGAEAVRAFPLFLLFLGLAGGIWHFARVGFTRRLIGWLRLSAGAALLWTLSGPVARSMRAWAFDPLFTGAPRFRLPIDFYDVGQGLLIAGAALVALWAIEEAMALRSEAEEFV